MAKRRKSKRSLAKSARAKARHKIMLRNKGRKKWHAFKARHSTLASEQLANLNHFKSI